jgi:hypothetical protein
MQLLLDLSDKPDHFCFPKPKCDARLGTSLERERRQVGFSGLYYKSFTIVIYVRNDSGQYYKTAIYVWIVS